jgi:hypothetical protein
VIEPVKTPDETLMVLRLRQSCAAAAKVEGLLAGGDVTVAPIDRAMEVPAEVTGRVRLAVWR